MRIKAGNVVSSLLDGFSATDALKSGQYRYYRYFDTHPNEAIWLDLKPSGGDADIFVGCTISSTGDDSGYPSRSFGHSNFSSTSYLEDTLSITPELKKACMAPGATTAIFYVAVYAYAEVTYTLSAMHESGTTSLTAGVPYTGLVYKRLGRKFALRVGYEVADLTVQLMPIYGDCDLFVKMNGPADTTHFDFYSIKSGSAMDVVTIPETSICTNCWIGITIYGYETSRFSLLAFFEDTTVAISNGMPIRGSVQHGSTQYYAYHNDVNGTSDVVTTLTIFSGATPSLYMSSSVQTPNASTPNTVKLLYNAHAGTVPILTLPSVLKGKTVYVGIEGVEGNCSYTVRAHSVSIAENALPPILSLVEGLPQVIWRSGILSLSAVVFICLRACAL